MALAMRYYMVLYCPIRLSHNDTNTLSICDGQHLLSGAGGRTRATRLVLGGGMPGTPRTGTDLAHRDQQRRAYAGRDHV